MLSLRPFSGEGIAWFADKPFRFSEAFDIRVSDCSTSTLRCSAAAAARRSDGAIMHRPSITFASQRRSRSS